MVNKRLFLHVGTNKAASTSIQMFFSNFNEVDLDYVYLHDEYRLGEDIAQIAQGNPALCIETKQRLQSKISPCSLRNNIISSENFWTPILSGDLNVARKIAISTKACLDWIDTKILIVFRRQDTLLESQYLWKIKGSRLFRKDFPGFMKGKAASDWNAMATIWEQVFGPENVHVIPFELIKTDTRLLSQRLMRFLDIQVDADFTIQFGQMNPGLSAEGVEYLLAHPVAKDHAEQQALRKYVEDNYSRDTGSKPDLLTARERADFLAPIAESNQTLLSRYGYDPTLWDTD